MLAIGTINIFYFWTTGSKFILTPYLVLYFVISFMGLFLFRLYVEGIFSYCENTGEALEEKNFGTWN
jgi:hypothetical protein